MPQRSSFRASHRRASVSALRSRGARSVPLFALACCAALSACVFASGGCSDTASTETGGTGTFTGSSSSGAGGAASSSSSSGQGGEIFGSSSSGGMKTCDQDPGVGKYVFASSLGGSGGAYVSAVAVSKTGEIAIAGGFTGTVDFGTGALTSAGGSDAFLVKLDSSGQALWSKKFGAGDQQAAKGVAIDTQGNVFITGYYLGSISFGGASFTKVGCCFEDMFVAKFDAAGNHVWSKGFGDQGADNVAGIAVDSKGNPVFTGTFQSTIAFGGPALTAAAGGALDVYVAKLDASGNHMWSKSFGDASDQIPNAIALGPADEVHITGSSKGIVNFGGSTLTAAAGGSAFIAKFSEAGAHLWSSIAGDGAKGTALAVNASGDVIFAGDYKGMIDLGGGALTAKTNENAFIARLGSDGKHVWSVTFLADASHVTSAAFDSKDRALIGGNFLGTMTVLNAMNYTAVGGADGFLVKLDSVGCHGYSRAFGAAGYQSAIGVAVDSSDNGIVTGNFTGAVDLGGGALSANTDMVFVAKYQQ